MFHDFRQIQKQFPSICTLLHKCILRERKVRYQGVHGRGAGRVVTFGHIIENF